MGFLKSLNWVDILIAALAVRIVYISVKTGFVTEFMKTLATLIAVFLAFHYYTKLAAILSHAAGAKAGLTDPVIQTIVFAVIWGVTLLIVKFIRDGLFLIFTVQTISAVDRWGAVVVSIARFCLTASMLMFVFLLTDQPYMERMTTSSFSQKYVLFVAPDTYRKIADGFVAKFFPSEKSNTAVVEELHETGKK